MIGHVYGYRLEPAGDQGTLVTSYYDWSSIHPHWREAGIFPVIPRGAAGHARHPGPDGRPGLCRRPDLTHGVG